ncbi:MAG: 5-amino-6-(D-ribitylamino)uracil--L-tyrosine 4-hydroxyphenyl transferase CofH [Methanomicrobium sp.]|nr:5-amino-6-(D-ribitylamino)uracil--L-tyrosine 4-hydroxyphenyl transferase CofH [Methanomicrobium sp.]
MPKLENILKDTAAGDILSENEALFLLKTKGREIFDISKAADALQSIKCKDQVTYVKNQNINVTNCCVNTCGFCGFCKKPGDEGLYFFTPDIIQNKVREAKERGVTEICTVSGLHPEFNADSYINTIKTMHDEAPEIHIHASNPMEIAYGAEKSGITTLEMLKRMKGAGLETMCGTAAEILSDEVRKIICPGKIDTETWERIIKEAHSLGILTTATIMYGHVETYRDVVSHLRIIRDIQEETKGFTEFVPLSFVHFNTPIYRKGIARAGATGREDLLMYAVSRLYLHNFRNIQVSWVKHGIKFAQLALLSGANDLGGTMFEESISKGAGAKNTDYLDPKEMQRISSDIGRELCQRDTRYNLL